jgi:hypothetical protein
VADKLTKKYRQGPAGEEPVELTEVVEEPSDDNYVLYGSGERRPRSKRRSLIDLGALEDVALREAQRATAAFLAEHGADVLAEEARQVLEETAREVAPQVAREVFRERAVEMLAPVAQQAALAAAREVVGKIAAEVIERVVREIVPKVAEEVILREIEKLKAQVKQGLS